MIEKGARRMLKKNGKMQAFVRFATLALVVAVHVEGEVACPSSKCVLDGPDAGTYELVSSSANCPSNSCLYRQTANKQEYCFVSNGQFRVTPNACGLLSSVTPYVTPSVTTSVTTSVTPSCTNPKLLEPSKITCTASSSDPKFGCEQAFDGSAICPGTGGKSGYNAWMSEGETVGAWIQADFGKSITITTVKILSPSYPENAAKKITISFDNNVQNPDELNDNCSNGWNDISLLDPVESKTMKITFNEMHDFNPQYVWAELGEVEIYGCY